MSPLIGAGVVKFVEKIPPGTPEPVNSSTSASSKPVTGTVGAAQATLVELIVGMKRVGG